MHSFWFCRSLFAGSWEFTEESHLGCFLVVEWPCTWKCMVLYWFFSEVAGLQGDFGDYLMQCVMTHGCPVLVF